jgi:hypothetical protein
VLGELTAGRVLVCVEANEQVHDTIGRFQDGFHPDRLQLGLVERAVSGDHAQARLGARIDALDAGRKILLGFWPGFERATARSGLPNMATSPSAP